MSRFDSLLTDPSSHDAQRWMPPDVGAPPPEGPSEPSVHLPTAEEVAAIEEAARSGGFEAGHQAGHEAGYQEGRELALREAETEALERQARESELREQLEKTLGDTVGALEGIARDLADPLASAVDDLEPELLNLVTTLARRVVMEELSVRPELIQQVLHQALTQLPSRKHPVRLHVNPEDRATLEAYADSRDEVFAWLEDSAIERGGCLVESGASRIDAGLESRLRQGIDAIWGELAPSPPPQAEQGDDRQEEPQEELREESQEAPPEDLRAEPLDDPLDEPGEDDQ